MYESENVHTIPMQSRFDFDEFDHRIETTLKDYDKFVAKDHELAVEGLKNEVESLRLAQNG